MPDLRLLSQRKYAKLRGLSHQAVGKAVKSGRIPTVGGKIDPVAADAAWAGRTRPRSDIKVDHDSTVPAPAEMSDPGNGHDPATQHHSHATYAAARAVREVCLAKQSKIELEQMEGKLVSVEEVKAQAFEAARAIRDLLLALPARLAPVLFAARDVATCQLLLEEAMREVCAGISPEGVAAKVSGGRRGTRKSR